MEEKAKRKILSQGRELLLLVRKYFNSYIFYGVTSVIACLFVLFNQEVTGVITLGGLLCVLLVVCDDILPTTLPFLLLCAIATNCYDSFHTFIGYAVYAPIVATALITHFVVYHKPYKSGASVTGICAVSCALLLGGIGSFTLKQYAYGAYYVLGLGVGMLVCYYAMKSQFSVRRTYDVKSRFAVIMTLMGVVCVLMILIGYARTSLDLSTSTERGFSRNNLSTLLMFSMPFPLYKTQKKDFGALLTLLFFGGICLTTSRGGLIFGGVEFLICCVYWICSSNRKKQRLTYCLIAGAILFLGVGGVVIDVIKDRILSDNAIVGSVRHDMIIEAIERFRKRPVFGSGLLDNSIAYGEYRKAGTMAWYHMMIPQIVGSMGLIGVCAYLFQGIGRIKLIVTDKNDWSLILGISYLGILLMSQVNPGEFCPLPFELLTVLLFILQEERLDERKLPLLRNLKRV